MYSCLYLAAEVMITNDISIDEGDIGMVCVMLNETHLTLGSNLTVFFSVENNANAGLNQFGLS